MKEKYTKKEAQLLLRRMKKKYIKTLKCYQTSGDGPDYSYSKNTTYSDGYKRGVDNCIEALEELELEQ